MAGYKPTRANKMARDITDFFADGKNLIQWNGTKDVMHGRRVTVTGGLSFDAAKLAQFLVDRQRAGEPQTLAPHPLTIRGKR